MGYLPMAIPAIAPALRPESLATAATAGLVVDAGALVADPPVVDVLDEEELELLSPGGVDSSGKFYHSVSLLLVSSSITTDHTWPGCNIYDDFLAPSRWTSKLVSAFGLMTPTMP